MKARTTTMAASIGALLATQPLCADVSDAELSSIKTPDKVETSIGTLSFLDGAPYPETVIMTAAATALLGLGAVASGVQAAPGAAQSGTVTPLILAATDGMERRDDNRDDRQEDRGDRGDNRQDCRQEEGAGADKRDCKQDGRKDEAGES